MSCPPPPTAPIINNEVGSEGPNWSGYYGPWEIPTNKMALCGSKN